MIGIFADLLLAVLVARWVLAATPLQVSSKACAVVHALTEPYIGFVRRHLAPTWHGKDVSFFVSVCLLVALRFVATIFRF